ncbi:MAG: cupin domain-containing protein [Deinococcales bacterium]|nr:cupin domain-containing protein [Deinococcales bacterium]
MNKVRKTEKWRTKGVRVVSTKDLDHNTPQTSGMIRAAAFSKEHIRPEKLWAGTVTVQPDVKTGAHHHGELESIIYVVSGRARMRWGDHLEYVAEAEPGDFIFVPPYVPHQEINALSDKPLKCVLVRSGQDPIVVNLDLAPVDDPETVGWSQNDLFHKKPD